MKIVVAGGGTAGHIEPALNIADAIVERHPDAKILALGTERGLETTLVPARGYPLELIPAVPFPRRINNDLFTLPSRLKGAVAQCRELLRDADVLVGFGGYVALPAYLAARGRIPIVIHEANARPGLANRVGARFASAVAETVAGSMKSGILTGIPLRVSIQNFDRNSLAARAREHFNIPLDAPVILVFGGSQGAVKLNTVIEQCRQAGIFRDVHVIHAVGMKNELPIDSGHTYHAVHYIEQMNLAYAAADFVIARSGAMTVAELTAVGLPACYVPLPIGNGEQKLNADHVVKAGGAILVTDADFTPKFVSDVVMPIVTDKSKLASMAQISAGFGRRDAGSRIVDIIDRVIAGGV
ncbi:MAG: undecaprenyldiphospho-muramoylpentapeptide beta-N-acetylglucosaminyltransferase [Actinobacteria bacterium]|nr:undecaprenyldiphospho-muramoylpentapeptide beta-N-acetylglucosaminyltransferase [Actinomycetota bacterium]